MSRVKRSRQQKNDFAIDCSECGQVVLMRQSNKVPGKDAWVCGACGHPNEEPFKRRRLVTRRD